MIRSRKNPTALAKPQAAEADLLRARRPALRGFTITEMLTALILFTAVGLISARLFRATMRAAWDAPEAQNSIHQSEAILRQLRADCWNAVEISKAGTAGADVRLPGGAVVQWRIDETSITRTLDQDHAAWPREVAGKGACELLVEGSVLTLRVGDTRVTTPSELSVINRGRAP